MILLLGASGYVGSAYQAYFNANALPYRAVSRRDCDYYQRDKLVELIKQTQATFLINAAGYTGKPNVDACEIYKTECLLGNAILPGVIMEACNIAGIPWGHVSSGCIYSGKHADGRGFNEADCPNFSFRSNHCSFYSGTKALGEEILKDTDNCYIWRLRIPFNHIATPRNYLTKVMSYPKLLDAENSISHLEEFVEVSWQCWQRKIPFGIYNLTNPGSITTREVVGMIQTEAQRRESEGVPHSFPKNFSFFENETEFMQLAAKTPRSNCVMDTAKLEAQGIKMRPCRQAIEEALRDWSA